MDSFKDLMVNDKSAAPRIDNSPVLARSHCNFRGFAFD